jgi:F420-dependent oxidoreductase-like protein
VVDVGPGEAARRLPSPCIVVLVGPSGSGKSTWAAQHFRADQIVSSDALRAVVGEGPYDVAASTDAFAVLEDVVARRVARRLTTVVDTLGLEPQRRQAWLQLGRQHGMACVAVGFDTSPAECRARNRLRDVPVPAAVLTGQLRAWPAVREALESEGYDLVLTPEPVRAAPATVAATARLAVAQRDAPVGLRFGLHIPAFSWPGGPGELGPRLRAIAATAEQAGFDSIWVLDHFRQIRLFGRPWDDMLESYTVLAHLAAVTERVRLGAMVTGITYRNVAHLGKIVATLDVLSGGRAVCGLGLAWMEEEHRAYGWPFPPRSERYALLEDALELLPLLWGPGTPAFEGRVLRVPEALCYPRPLQAHLPILLGGGGERRTLRLVARLADACNIIGGAPVVQRKLEVLHRHCAAVGRDPATIEVTQLSTTLVGRDTAEVDALVERLRPRRVGSERYAAHVNAGTVDDQVGRFRALADAGVELAVVSLPDLADTAALERFAEVIAPFR